MSDETDVTLESHGEMHALEIEGLANVRAAGADAPWLIRSASPDAVGAVGAAQLRELGVTVVVDLREVSEGAASSHGLPVESVPLYGRRPPAAGRLEDIYEDLLRTHGEALARAVGAVADAAGAALVHCTAGKDRTGLIVALARTAAGAEVTEVVDDYTLSGAAVRPLRAEYARAAAEGAATAQDRAEILRLHLESPREAIEHALAVIDSLGGAEAYLRHHGLTSEQLRALRRKHEAAA